MRNKIRKTEEEILEFKKSKLKSKQKKSAHVQNLALNKKSTFFDQSP